MHLLFDLDGTLTDSRVGVTRCLEEGLVHVGADVPSIEQLTRYIGPPLAASFETLIGTADPERVERAIAAYRRRFETVGIFENVLYPGVVATLGACAAAGHALCVVTAKPHVYARRILEDLGIAPLFGAVYGPDLNDRSYSKETLIRLACEREPVRASSGLVIGDRAEDVRGAKCNNLDAVAVTWGYGSREELEAAQPSRIVSSAGELTEYLLAAR